MRRRWRWRCVLCLGQGYESDELTAVEEFERHYRQKHQGGTNGGKEVG